MFCVEGVVSFWLSYVDLRRVRQDNARLRSRADALQTELHEIHQRAGASARLRTLLELQQRLEEPGRAAEVIARSGLPWFRTLILGRGSSDRVSLDAPVISPAGVVGRVIAVAAGTSKVQVLLDQHSGTAVLVDRTRVSGVVSGQVGSSGFGPRDLLMKYVPQRSDVATGDLVVTSGLDGIYPKGLVVGHVIRVAIGSGLFQDVHVRPSVAFDRLEEVLVLRPRQATPLLLEEPR